MKLNAVLLLLLCCGCETLRWESLEEKADEPRHLYSCAISYPDGYDWRKDSLEGDITADILLFKDSSIVLSVEASASRHISKDPDCHHLVNGKLISEYSSPSDTWLSVDGRELLEISGREKIHSLLEAEDTLYTLWVPRSGSGFTLRRNSETIMRRKDCTPTGILHEDNGCICFAFRETVPSTGGDPSYRHYTVEDGKCTLLDHGPDCGETVAARRLDGVWNFILKTGLGSGWLWRAGTDDCLIDTGRSLSARDFGFAFADGALYAHAQLLNQYASGYFWNDYYWERAGVKARSIQDGQVTAFCEGGKRLCFACAPLAGTAPLKIIWNGESYAMDERYRLTSSSALCCSDKNFYIGVNSDSAHPVLCSRDEEQRFGFNGFFICLDFP